MVVVFGVANLACDLGEGAYHERWPSRLVATAAAGCLRKSKTRLSLGMRTRTALIAYAIICPLIWGGVMLVHMLQTPGVSQ